MHQSIATIDSPEFINLQPLDINPLMSKCEIKVLYVGENRNRSFISKEVAMEMSKTLRGAPIVGYFKEESGDFVDHGEQVVIDHEGLKFKCLTKPYGFVAPDAQVWFQKFNDVDDFGNEITREYLMTTGFLWTGQFEECKIATDEGRPHSMELDEATLNGKWSENVKSGIEFFIINDAIFSKLCILGEDVEPCFEGSSITAPNVSKNFTKMDANFKNTLFSMIEDLKKYALEGGQPMEVNQEISTVEEVESVVEPAVETPVVEYEENQGENVENTIVENEENIEEAPIDSEFAKEDEEEENQEEATDEDSDDSNSAEEAEEEKKDEEEDKDQKYNLLNDSYNALQAQFAALESKYNELVAFKNQIDNAKKDELIQSFYMLSDEDKKDVIENKATYSYEEIEAKLSVICFRKKINFNLENDDTTENNESPVSPVVTFNLNETENSVPAFISALRNTQNTRK
jgi:hypothetical protein